MRGIIFDMDDTLVATAPAWRRAETRLLESLGAKWSEELSRQYKGMNALDVAATIHRIVRPALPVEECQRRMRSWLLEDLRQRSPLEMPGAAACVERLAKHARLAVASGSPMEAIEALLRRLGMWGHFAVVISSEEVVRGKPSPDVFLAAAQRLGAAPADCVVIEDSLVGVEAALAAGMKCFAVPSGAHEEIRRKASRVFESLQEITWAEVEDALGPA